LFYFNLLQPNPSSRRAHFLVWKIKLKIKLKNIVREPRIFSTSLNIFDVCTNSGCLTDRSGALSTIRIRTEAVGDLAGTVQILPGLQRRAAGHGHRGRASPLLSFDGFEIISESFAVSLFPCSVWRGKFWPRFGKLNASFLMILKGM
jgi:hypothetical protein